MRATVPQRLRITFVIIYETVRIALIAMYRVKYRGGYPRWYGDIGLKWWAGKCIDAVRIDFTVIDPHQVRIEPGKRYIIMSNHRSHYDIPLLTLTMPGSLRMLTKKELFKIPIYGPGLTAGEFISIDRSDLEQAKKDLAFAREKMESGIVLWIAPEGTRSRTGRMGPFKKGGFIMAIESGATIIPVGIQGSETVLKPKTWEFFLRQKVAITIGSPIEASAYAMEQKDQLLEDVRESIARLCGEAEEESSASVLHSVAE